LRRILPAVAAQISFNYEIDRPLNVGGSGVVSVVTDKNLNTQRALKVSRPSPGKERLLAKVLQSETATLLRLSHPNLIRIFAQGAVEGDGGALDVYPYYVMEFVNGVQDADIYLRTGARTESDVINIFSAALSAVEYLHSQGTIHMDLKPANIFVTPAGIPIISDLGFAKHLTTQDGYTIVGGTEGFIHPEARKFVVQAVSDPNRLQGEATRAALRPEWDLFSLGKTFLTLLREIDSANPKALTPYVRRYLKLLACRLLDGRNEEHERALGLAVTTLAEIKYHAVSEAKVDLEKLIGSYNLEYRIPEVNLFVQDTIQASTIATTPFTPRVKKLVAHPVVRQLGGFHQLGLLNLVYPTATHTRLEHAIGTFSILCRTLHALYNDPLNPLFKQIMNEVDLRAILLVGLLHDIGHYPLAHDLEEADEAIFSHETLTKELLEKSASLRRLLEGTDDESWNVSPDRLLAILNAKPRLLEGTLKDRILRTLIDGPIDADKIDYIMRDSLNLGVTYGRALDTERLLHTLTVVIRDEGDKTYAAIGIHEKGKIPAESIMFARYALFGQVYWHHAYRAIKAMLQRLVWEYLIANDAKRASIRDEFRRFVKPQLSESDKQPPLFYADSNLTLSFAELGQVHQSDASVIKWFATRCGDVGQRFYEHFVERTFYKRILVLSREKAADKALWEQVSSFYRANKKMWRRKLRLQQEFQKEIVAMVQNPPEPAPESVVITPDIRNRFLATADVMPVLLVDFPPERRGSEIPLEYIVEEDRRRVKQDEMRVGSLEQSVVWNALQKSSHESIGKLRVYCHPDFSDYVGALLTRSAIESALSTAVTRVEADT
jgi:HD superfamily phosphohydrolase